MAKTKSPKRAIVIDLTDFLKRNNKMLIGYESAILIQMPL
jgi:hypothetical protein